MNERSTFFNKIRKIVPLLNIGTFLAIILPVAYVLGLSFYQGYLNAFGVTSELFPRSTQEIYVYAYYAVAGMLSCCYLIIINSLKEMNGYWSIFIFFVTTIAVSAVSRYAKLNTEHPIRKRGTAILSSFTTYCKFDSTDPASIVLTALSYCYLLMLLLLITTLCWVLPSYIAYSAGQKIAAKEIENFRESGCKVDPKNKLNTCVLIKDEDGKILHEGLLVVVNEKQIALFDKKGSSIFAKKEGFVIQRKSALTF